MEFEPIDENLEDALRVIIEGVDECTGCADSVDCHTPEYRALQELGLFSETEEFLDGTASVKPTYAALKYFDNKAKWEKERKTGVVKAVGEKAVDIVTDVAASIAVKMTGM